MKQHLYLLNPQDLLLLDVHLQWFAAEDEGRTEDPTEHKIKKAREDGKVAKSAEIPAALTMLVGIITIAILGPWYMSNLTGMVKFFLSRATTGDMSEWGLLGTAFLNFFATLTAPVLAVTFIAALVGNIAQVGFVFSSKPIIPDFSRIAPKFGKYLQRSFASAEAAFNLGKAILKIIIIGVIAYINIMGVVPKLVNLMKVSFLQGFGLIVSTGFNIMIEAAVVMLVISIPDYFFQRRQHKESLKMTKQEVKEERKQYEGDPLIKSRMRERMRQILTQNMMKEVPRADVVVTNPTHFAVAIRWDRDILPAPKVTAKGEDHMAARIREIATEAGVPLVENKPLARALYAEVEVGDVIPEKFYEAAALVLAGIYKANDARKKTG